MRAHCDLMRQRRNECCLQSARELEAMYPQFRTEQALEYRKDSGVLYKCDLMRALQHLGLSDGNIYGETYHYLFGWEPRGVVLHSPGYPPVEQVLDMAHKAGPWWSWHTRRYIKVCRWCGNWLPQGRSTA